MVVLYCIRVRVHIIGHLQPCMTEIYIHIDARMADYMDTHPYRRWRGTRRSVSDKPRPRKLHVDRRRCVPGYIVDHACMHIDLYRAG